MARNFKNRGFLSLKVNKKTENNFYRWNKAPKAKETREKTDRKFTKLTVKVKKLSSKKV